jgi:hypothetical protein
MSGSTHLVGALVALCLSLTCVSTPAWAGTGYVDGISDQNLFDVSWVGSPPPHVELARYVVQWDVMRGAGYPEEFANLQRWYDRAVELRLTPELALDDYDCSDCAAPRDTAEYTAELEALYRSLPDTRVVEAWNEPNNSRYTSYVTPVLAAHFMNAAYSFCKAHACTAIAGDFLDSESNMVKYEDEYERNLQPRDPGNWGIHPYHAIKYMTDSTVTGFREALPDPAADHIWFTEVGAYYCEYGQTYGERSQEEQARFLVRDLIPEFQPTHVFYDELTLRYAESPRCDSGQADTALYAAKNSVGSLLARSAAGVIFGPEPAPRAELTGGAATAPAAEATQAVHFACEPALDEQWQRGECLYAGEVFEL